jgi:5-methylcytosine-specific restriction endonuclease McrA
MLELVPPTKVCTKCKEGLSLEAFGPKRRGKFGRKSECKKCLAEKEEVRRTSDPEACRAYKRKWWAENPRTPEQKETSAFKSRSWYAQNKSRRRVTLRAWIKNNPDRFKEIQRRYLVKSPVHVRRAAHWALIEKNLTEAEWSETLAYFNHACAYCLRSDVPLTMDHIIPVSKGGPHTQGNVVPSCKSCNSRKGARLLFVMLGRDQTQTEI